MAFPDPLAWGVTPMIPSSNRFFRRFHRWKPAGKLIFWGFPPVHVAGKLIFWGFPPVHVADKLVFWIFPPVESLATGFLGGFFRR